MPSPISSRGWRNSSAHTTTPKARGSIRWCAIVIRLRPNFSTHAHRSRDRCNGFGRCRRGGGQYEGAARSTRAAVDRLVDVLLPHLQREEDEMMPVVSSVVTNAECQAIEREYNLEPKSFFELGREGHWLIDEADPEDRARRCSVSCHRSHGSFSCTASPVRIDGGQQPVGIHLRPRADACRSAAVARSTSTRAAMQCGASSVMSLALANGATNASGSNGSMARHRCFPAARFRGRNRSGLFRWGRVCEVVDAEPYELVWRTLPSSLDPATTEWRIRLHPAGRGTRIEQTYIVRGAPKTLLSLYGILVPGHRDRTVALTDDMRRLGALASRAAPAAVLDSA